MLVHAKDVKSTAYSESEIRVIYEARDLFILHQMGKGFCVLYCTTMV